MDNKKSAIITDLEGYKNSKGIITNSTDKNKGPRAIVTDFQQYQLKKSQQAIKVILDQISSFMVNIFNDTGVDSDKWSYKIQYDTTYFCLYICNGESAQIVGKTYGLLWFMEQCAQKKIEFELNKTVREMILKAESNKNPNGEIIWL